MGLDGGGDVKDLSSLRPLASSVFLLARGISVPQLHPSACQRGLLDPENSLPSPDASALQKWPLGTF